MNAKERRDAMLTMLQAADAPTTGRTLAALFKVSRQVVVQDMAILRASGARILSTADGYVCERTHGRVTRVFACTHMGLERLREELFVIVDHGGTVRDILVEHPVYGTIRGMLMLSSRMRVEEFVQKPDWDHAEPLSSLTGGAHLHTVEAETTRELDAIEAALRTHGFLME